MEERIKFRVLTPLGWLEVYQASNPDCPGVCIDIEGEPVALVEYSPEQGLRTVAWVKGEEDYEAQTVYDWDGHITHRDAVIAANWETEGDFVPNPTSSGEVPNNLWDGDYGSMEYQTMFARTRLPEGDLNKLYVYTVISEGEKGYIVEGVQVIDRLGYIFSKKPNPLPEESEGMMRCW